MLSELLRFGMITGLALNSIACTGPSVDSLRNLNGSKKPEIPNTVATNIMPDPDGDPYKVRLRGSSEIDAAKIVCGMIQGRSVSGTEIEMTTEKPNCREMLLSYHPTPTVRALVEPSPVPARRDQQSYRETGISPTPIFGPTSTSNP